uniref:Hydrolase or acyltransferase of alpha/beta superfamily n=1 Tax=Desulfovibrio sp. U5L TaxID=596152 RepID=I2Q359_9BACT
MTDVLFLSGWAGPETLFPGLSGRWTFAAPFLDGDEAALLARIEASPARVLSGWSTGAHMLVKHAAGLFPRFERVVLFAPFLRFADSLPARVTRAMAAGLATDAEAVTRGFWKNCGLPEAAVQTLDWDPAWASPLADGLAYLLASAAPDAPVPAGNVTVVHGAADRIVRPSAVEAVASVLDGAAVVRHHGGHWPDPTLLGEHLFP